MAAATVAARRYARAAFEVARDEGNPERWLEELQQVAQVLADDELQVAFKNPNIPNDVKFAVVDRLLPNLTGGVKNLVRLVVAHRRTAILGAIATDFHDYLNQYRGREQADIVSARPLGDVERKLIADRLNEMTGHTVDIRSSVDPSIIGGIVIRLGDRLIDASVVTRLERLRHRLA